MEEADMIQHSWGWHGSMWEDRRAVWEGCLDPPPPNTLINHSESRLNCPTHVWFQVTCRLHVTPSVRKGDCHHVLKASGPILIHVFKSLGVAASAFYIFLMELWDWSDGSAVWRSRLVAVKVHHMSVHMLWLSKYHMGLRTAVMGNWIWGIIDEYWWGQLIKL